MRLCKIIYSITLLSITFSAFGQIEEPPSVKETFQIHSPAAYRGGEGAMNKFISENLEYPDYSIRMEAEGTIHIQFIVEKDGSLSNIKVVKSTCRCGTTSFTKRERKKYGEPDKTKACDLIEQASVNVISSMPNWIPAQQRGKPVRMQFRLPLNFKLS